MIIMMYVFLVNRSINAENVAVRAVKLEKLL